MGDRYLVTGAAGFIGSAVTRALLERGDAVIGIDNLNDAYDVRLKHWRLERLRGHPGFTHVDHDIADALSVHESFEAHGPFAAVINLAARAGVRQSVERPQVYVDTNVTGTLNLLRECAAGGAPKFVLASTSSLYGISGAMPFLETQSTDRPLSPYAASKKAAEALCYTYHHLSGIDVSVVRYFTVYGPAGRPDMSLFRFVQWISEGRPVLVYGDGSQTRDFTYVDDIARGTLAALQPVGYEVINLGSDRPHALSDTIRMVENITGKTARIFNAPFPKTDVMATWAGIDKARRMLGWEPATDLQSGVAALVSWYEENRAWARDINTE